MAILADAAVIPAGGARLVAEATAAASSADRMAAGLVHRMAVADPSVDRTAAVVDLPTGAVVLTVEVEATVAVTANGSRRANWNRGAQQMSLFPGGTHQFRVPLFFLR